jgi:hypothetical protein
MGLGMRGILVIFNHHRKDPMTKPIIDRATIEAERLDAIRQRDEYQQKANEAQALSQRAQQMAQEAAQGILIANGMIQQNDFYLKMLSTKGPTDEAPAPAP